MKLDAHPPGKRTDAVFPDREARAKLKLGQQDRVFRRSEVFPDREARAKLKQELGRVVLIVAAGLP